MLNQVTRRIRQTEAILAIAGLRRVEDRLLQLLKLLKQEMGESLADERSRISIRLTHQNIANAIGTTRVTVTRLLGEFQRQDIITVDNERHIIL
jgi:CRP-like cAMP-binding protein